MGRTLKTILLLLLCIGSSKSQCPDLPNNTTVNGSTSTSIAMCGAMSADFEVNDVNLPTGTIDWYSSTTSGFDPLSTGTLLGSSSIDSADPCDPGGCPRIEVIFIDACGSDEALNEFMVISSGSGFAVDDLSVTFDDNNTFGSAGNGNINVGGVCVWSDGDPTLFSGCASLIAVGPGDYIPPNSAVIIQTSSFGNTTYDVSSLCGVSDCIYVLKNGCDRNVGAFSNCGGGVSMGSTRTNEIALTCGCSDVLVYDILDPGFIDVCTMIGNNGMHVFNDLTYANNLCDNGPILGSIPQYSYSAVTDPFNYTFTDAECNTTQYVVGVLNSTQFNTDCCVEQITNEYAFDISCINAELQGSADLCPGECEEITVQIDGGVSPYDLNLSILGLPFPFDDIMLPFVGFPISEKITICFDTGGPLIDEDNFIVNVPGIAGGFSGSLILNSIEDDNDCAGTISGSAINLSFNDAPDINNPGVQQACDLGDGTGIFILSDLDLIINGGTAATVNYFSDMDGTIPISSPYTSASGSIYAQVLGDPCDSEIIEIPLDVIFNGNAGVVSLFCNNPSPSSSCDICDDDGVPGEDITLTIIFEDPNLNYDYEIVWTEDSGGSSTIVGSGIGMNDINFNITETTTFAVTVVTKEDDCPDMTNLGDVVVINYSLQPDIDQPDDLTGCGMVTLPAITGSIVTANAGYFTESGGMGTMYNPGDVLTTSTTLFVYDGIENCDVEYTFDVTIEEEAIIDAPANIESCGVYSLPPITGTNVDNVSYYTEIDGGGNMLSPGSVISVSTTLYLFDSNCGGNQPSFEITITPGPIIDNNPDTVVCEMYIVEAISGMDLSGNEAYFDESNGNGNSISIGDTITTDSILYIYDNTGGCEVEVPVFVSINQPAFPGLDTAIIVCEGDPTLVDINASLGGGLPDSNGVWLDVNMTGLLDDSTQVDFSSLTIGSYLFEYQIADSICVDTQSILTVNVVGIPNAGTDASISICQDTSGVNILSLLGNPDTGGTLYDELNMAVGFDPEDADFSASTIGTMIFTYIVGNPLSSCGADSSTFTVVVEEAIEAGDDVMTSSCAGSIVDLSLLLTNNSTLGQFIETTPSGGLSGNNFDTDLVGDGEYEILHILNGSGNCPSDTATITLSVSDAANAGDENTVELCGEITVSLTDFINGDAGGQFYFENNLLPSGDLTFSNEVGSFDYLYIVGDGIDCPFDTATITVQRNIRPATFLDIDVTSLCEGECTTVSFNAANNGGQGINLYYHIESDLGESLNGSEPIGDFMPDVEITLCVGDAGLINDELMPGATYTFMLDSIELDNPNCIFLDGASVVFSTFPNPTTDLTGNYCLDDQVMVGDDIYDQNNSSGTTIIENGSQAGCDSIINVDFIFQEVAEGTFMENYCEGDSVTINNVLYTESNNTDEFIIPNGSQAGCDSLVMIDITFLTSTTGIFEQTICSGDTIVINNEAFFVGNELGVQLLENQNSVGCDSIVEVFIEVDDPISSDFTGDYCTSFSVDINGTTYDQSNPSGIEIFNNQAQNGCDSLVMVDLTFNAMPIDSIVDISTCDLDFTLTIGTSTFDASNPTGTVDLMSNDPAACDTTVEVAIQFGSISVDFTEVDGSCNDNDTGAVIIVGSSGTPPYNITYNGNNIIAFILPLQIDLPVGSGEINIVDDTGCAQMLEYELFPGGEDAFDIFESQGQISITGSDIDSILWSPTEGLSCTDCIDPIASPNSTTTYNATVFFDDSCTVNLEIEVVVIDNTPDYLLPNVFSPNNDNNNDNFILTITEGATGIPQEMLIFDRWDNLVYNGFGTDLTTIGWDGMFNGQNVRPGVYVYQLTVVEDGRPLIFYGDLTVVR